MKKIYEFVSYKPEVKEERVKEGDKEVINKVQTQVAEKFYIRKPNRSMTDDAELFYGVQLFKAINEGLPTRAQLSVKFTDESKATSQLERKDYEENLKVLDTKEKEYQAIKGVKTDEELSAEEKTALDSLIKDIISLRLKVQEFESNQTALFDYTAESRARNKTVWWWVFELSYRDNGTPVFGGNSFQEKLAFYDSLEDSDNEFLQKVVRKFLYLVSFWYSGRAAKPEDFENMVKLSGLDEPAPI
jgi:hypothetical protein